MATPENANTILLVDDDPDFLYRQRVRLEAAGYRVIAAEGESKAEEIMEKETPNVAVIDLMMEQMDGGFTLCRSMKRRHPSMPVILVTSVNNETGMDFDTATRLQRSWILADAFLAKPIRFEQLKTQIDRLLGESA